MLRQERGLKWRTKCRDAAATTPSSKSTLLISVALQVVINLNSDKKGKRKMGTCLLLANLKYHQIIVILIPILILITQSSKPLLTLFKTPKKRFGFLLPSETPPPPRFGKRPHFLRGFFPATFLKAQKPLQQASVAIRKIFASPENFCASGKFLRV